MYFKKNEKYLDREQQLLLVDAFVDVLHEQLFKQILQYIFLFVNKKLQNVFAFA